MHATLPLLEQSDFPSLRRQQLETLQVNLGYRCNLSCIHCHVNSSPRRKEMMDRDTIETVIEFLQANGISSLDLTGGAPEMNPHFTHLVRRAREMGVKVMDRCNLTILEEQGYEWLAGFLAEMEVEIVASLPCYQEENVNAQRGRGVFATSIKALRRLNELGYGKGGSLVLNLVYNPLGASLPPNQATLESAYKKQLSERYGIEFDHLFTITNMPIQRFGSWLISKGKFETYMRTLKEAYREENLENVMCRTLISVDWQGYVHDCDFNQMLGIPLRGQGEPRTHLSEWIGKDLTDLPIAGMDHCYGCTAGQGSSCGGALE